jgi:hypothetical protein
MSYNDKSRWYDTFVLYVNVPTENEITNGTFNGVYGVEA